jgi:hypothetical protein
MSTQSTHHITPRHPSAPQLAALAVLQGTLQAVAGWAFGHIFHFVSPLAGAIFGFTMGISHTIVAAFLGRLFGTSDIEKVAKFIISFLASVLIGIGVVALAGFAITIQAGFSLAPIGLLSCCTDVIFSFVLDCVDSARAHHS